MAPKPILRKVDPTRPAIVAAIHNIHEACFPGYEVPGLHGDWWIAYAAGKPVAFCGLWPSVSTPGAGYLCRAGVLPEARGLGLQRRMVRIREREARAKGWTTLFSDVDPENPPSMNNLFACGYRAFRPAAPWCGAEWVYVRKVITDGAA